MKDLSLFSGIGAFEKALDNMGIDYELIGFSEIDKYAIKSYCAIHNVDETANLGDITAIDTSVLPKDIDLVTYGFPCQDISLAGKLKGLFNADGSKTRSGLFFDALRIIEDTQPKVAIAENVKNLTGKKFKEQFEIVLQSLSDAGYNNYWKVLNAKDFGIPQNRERVFIVSIRKDIDNGNFKFPEGFSLELRLKDMLEQTVDPKYYIETPFNEYADLTCRTIKNQYYTNSKANFLLKTARGATGVEIRVREATKQGYAEACEGDTINLEQPNSKTRRGRVGKQIAQTLNTSPQQAVVVDDSFIGKHYQNFYDKNGYIPKMFNAYNETEITNIAPTQSCYCGSATSSAAVLISEPKIEVIGNYSPSGHDASRIVSENGIAPTVKENHGTVTATMQNLQIRKLTPLECWRLMGFDDEDFYKAEAVNSNTQLYKQAGNSIVVDVLEHLMKELFECGALEK